MPVRVRKFRPRVLIALVFLGIWAGMAAGPMGAGAESSRQPAEQAAVAPLPGNVVPASSVVVPAAADALAADDAVPPVSASDPAQLTATQLEATPAASSASALVPPERLYLEPILAQAARDYGLPVDLILAQAWAESGWRVDAVSKKGAVGVLQLMPNAVDFISNRLLKVDQPLDPRDPAANAHMAARFMRHLLDRLDGDLRQALMAYNQGLSGLRRKGPVPDAETYADKVLALRPVFAGLA